MREKNILFLLFRDLSFFYSVSNLFPNLSVSFPNIHVPGSILLTHLDHNVCIPGNLQCFIFLWRLLILCKYINTERHAFLHCSLHTHTHVYTHIFWKPLNSQSDFNNGFWHHSRTWKMTFGNRGSFYNCNYNGTIWRACFKADQSTCVLLLWKCHMTYFGLLHANLPKCQRRFKSSLWRYIEYIIKNSYIIPPKPVSCVV